MAWRDEMNALDSDVAAGRITAEEYRTKRDELLAGSGSGAAGGPNPFPPPFRWGAQATDGPRDPDVADRTQVVHPGPAPDADRTQVVRPGSAAPGSDRTQVVRPDADRTQVVRPGAPLPAQEHFPGSPPWQATQPAAGPPLPLRPGGTTPPWNTDFTPRQGPDSFGDFGAQPKLARWVAPAVAVVVAIVVIGSITLFVRRGDGSDTAGGAATTTSAAAGTSGSSGAAPRTPKQPVTPGRILSGLDGKSDLNQSGNTTVTQAATLSQFSLDEAALLATCGATAGTVDVLYGASWYTRTHAFSCKSAAAASSTAAALLQKQAGQGFVDGSTVGSVRVVTLDTATDVPTAPFDQRAFYVSGTSVVRVEVRGTTRADATRGLTAVLGAAMDNLPTS